MNKFKKWVSDKYHIVFYEQMKFWAFCKCGGYEIKSKLDMIGYLEEYLILFFDTFLGIDSNIFSKIKRENKNYSDIRYYQLVNEIELKESSK